MTDTIPLASPAQGAVLDTIDGVHVVRASAAQTGGEYEVFEVDAPRGPAIPPHRTPWGRTLYVLEGTLRVPVEQEVHELGPGEAITVPAGVAYTFEVLTTSAKFIGITTTDGAGKLFADIVRRVPRDQPMEQIVPIMLEVAARNGVAFVAE